MRLAPLLLLIALVPATARTQSAPAPLVRAVESFLHWSPRARDLPQFRYAVVDLNGDGQPDAIVLLTEPDWCGSGGCTMLVFRGEKDRFTLVSRSTITNEPVRVSLRRSHGWQTLIVHSKGVGEVLMRFSGRRYPLNPSRQPTATPAEVAAARVVIGP